MFEKSWRTIVVTLLAANLVFMALLELQRRTTARDERDYFARVEGVIKGTDITAAGREYIEHVAPGIETKLDRLSALLGDIDERVNNVEVRVRDVPPNIVLMSDMSARINAMQVALEKLSAAKP